jgi:queuine/archaeosine tRNA-ribosyltransferase
MRAVAALGRALQGGLRQPAGRALFGIVQGGAVPALRVASARELSRWT